MNTPWWAIFRRKPSEPKDETVLEIAMGITPEMERAIHVIRTAENANKTDTPEYGGGH